MYYVLHVRFSMGELSKRKSKPAHTARILEASSCGLFQNAKEHLFIV